MSNDQRQEAKGRLIAGMQSGRPWDEAARDADLRVGRATAYRLLRRARAHNDANTMARDGRHGHASKLRGPVRQWLAEYCCGELRTPGRIVRIALHDRFGLTVSISQINRIRAALGLSQRQGAGKKKGASAPPEQGWQDGAGGLLLLAAAHETGLLGTLEHARPTLDADGFPSFSPPLLFTLLFLNAVGLRRTWDLRGYTGDGLALLTGRSRAYSYRHAERFLSMLARAGGAEPLTDALATWTATLWRPHLRAANAPPPTFYIDGHRKPVYTDGLIPRGLVGRRGTVLGCRALVVLHDADGHPLLATTHRGDTHLTAGVGPLLDRFERAAGLRQVRRVVVDREGLAAAFLRNLAADGRTVVTVLRADQYADLDSFTGVGPFVPLRYDRQGALAREVAPARFTLALPDEPAERLEVRVALIRDLTRRGACPAPEEPGLAWDFSYDAEGRPWWEQGWVATPAPATLTAPKLVPIVTTAAAVDPVELARTYTRRWVAQENSFKDWLIPLGLDVNHGYTAVPVVNSEVEKRRAALEGILSAGRDARTVRRACAPQRLVSVPYRGTPRRRPRQHTEPVGQPGDGLRRLVLSRREHRG